MLRPILSELLRVLLLTSLLLTLAATVGLPSARRKTPVQAAGETSRATRSEAGCGVLAGVALDVASCPHMPLAPPRQDGQADDGFPHETFDPFGRAGYLGRFGYPR